ncbi:hypothetical protein QVD99_003353 [Batrachochytrium dendrobatidis]|nr:hypothetical protein QVD99_003353 [Batrachochytrium dendrobatidis]
MRIYPPQATQLSPSDVGTEYPSIARCAGYKLCPPKPLGEGDSVRQPVADRG